MAMKKSFKDENPAMQFIGQQGTVDPVPPENPTPDIPSTRQQGAGNPMPPEKPMPSIQSIGQQETADPAPPETPMPRVQSIGQQGAVEPAPLDPPAPRVQSLRQQGAPPMKLNPLYIETKSRHLNLLIQPSLHDKIKDIARARGASVNNTIHQILQDYVDSQGAK